MQLELGLVLVFVLVLTLILGSQVDFHMYGQTALVILVWLFQTFLYIDIHLLLNIFYPVDLLYSSLI